MSPAKKAAKKASKKSTAKRTAKKSTAKRSAKKTARKKNTAKKSGGRRSAAATGSVIVTTKLRDAIRAQDARMSSDFAEALNAEVHTLVARAAQRAKDNGRSTVRPSDL